MKQTIYVTGMTCEACDYKIKHLFSGIEGVQDVEINREKNEVLVSANRVITDSEFRETIKPFPKYAISVDLSAKNSDEKRTWFETYKPILLIFFYITVVTLLVQTKNQAFNWMEAMQHFMAGFFLVFSFFKLLNLKAFAESYAMYDVLASKIPIWGYIYALLELGLGIAFLIDFNPMLTSSITLIVMLISIVGVLKSVLNNKKIQCACLGSVFNLPMSTVTIIEDGLMIAMSAFMLFKMA